MMAAEEEVWLKATLVCHSMLYVAHYGTHCGECGLRLPTWGVVEEHLELSPETLELTLRMWGSSATAIDGGHRLDFLRL